MHGSVVGRLNVARCHRRSATDVCGATRDASARGGALHRDVLPCDQDSYPIKMVLRHRCPTKPAPVGNPQAERYGQARDWKEENANIFVARTSHDRNHQRPGGRSLQFLAGVERRAEASEARAFVREQPALPFIHRLESSSKARSTSFRHVFAFAARSTAMASSLGLRVPLESSAGILAWRTWRNCSRPGWK